jgi:hypothetical protein
MFASTDENVNKDRDNTPKITIPTPKIGNKNEKNILENATNIYNKELKNLDENLENGINKASSAMQQIEENIGNSNGKNDNSFSFNGFINSTSIITNVSFLLLVLIVFIILFQICLTIFISFITQSNNSPKLIDGMVDGNDLIVIEQDPSISNSITIMRSDNQANGIEFTWSVWLYIKNIKPGVYEHIFHKGDYSLATNGLNFPNNAPGLYISPNTNELTIIMNTYEAINEEITVPNIPLNKWFNVIIRCRNKTIDIYINSMVARSMELTGVPKQNYGNVYVAMNGGFNGNLSNLWYYNYALSTTEIDTLVQHGPNLKSANTSSNSKNFVDYLSLKWYWNVY